MEAHGEWVSVGFVVEQKYTWKEASKKWPGETTTSTFFLFPSAFFLPLPPSSLFPSSFPSFDAGIPFKRATVIPNHSSVANGPRRGGWGEGGGGTMDRQRVRSKRGSEPGYGGRVRSSCGSRLYDSSAQKGLLVGLFKTPTKCRAWCKVAGMEGSRKWSFVELLLCPDTGDPKKWPGKTKTSTFPSFSPLPFFSPFLPPPFSPPSFPRLTPATPPKGRFCKPQPRPGSKRAF